MVPLSSLYFCNVSRVIDFMRIPHDAVPRGAGPDKDCFVGKNKDVTITIKNGTTLEFRDIVVFGNLTFKSEDPDNKAVKGAISCRNTLVVGKQTLSNVNYSGKNFSVDPNFSKAVQDYFFEWIKFRKESVEDIGLKSILS